MPQGEHEYMKKTISYLLTFCWIIAVFTFTSCGDGSLDGQEETPAATEEPSVVPEPAATPEPATEEELRRAIKALGDEGDQLTLKGEYYERLYAMDAFGEEDYIALAQVYNAQGDWERQRLMLSKAMRLYPCQTYAEQVSGIIVRRDSGDEGAAALAAQMMAALEQQDAQALKDLTGTQEWKREMLGDLAGIMNRIQYRTENEVLQIAADGIYCEIVWCSGGGSLFFYRNDTAETAIGSAALGAEGYEGPVEVSFYDGEGNELQTYRGTMNGGVCTGQITVSYQGTEYTGQLGEDGRTLEEQEKGAASRGAVCYAYAPGGRAYLYQQDTTVEDFRIDAAYLALPEYEEWR